MFIASYLSHDGCSVIHLGETYGATLWANVWGQSTSKKCQELLLKNFRRVTTVPLPQWPGHLDELTIWRRVEKVCGMSMILVARMMTTIRVGC